MTRANSDRSTNGSRIGRFCLGRVRFSTVGTRTGLLLLLREQLVSAPCFFEGSFEALFAHFDTQAFRELAPQSIPDIFFDKFEAVVHPDRNFLVRQILPRTAKYFHFEVT